MAEQCDANSETMHNTTVDQCYDDGSNLQWVRPTFDAATNVHPLKTTTYLDPDNHLGPDCSHALMTSTWLSNDRWNFIMEGDGGRLPTNKIEIWTMTGWEYWPCTG